MSNKIKIDITSEHLKNQIKNAEEISDIIKEEIELLEIKTKRVSEILFDDNHNTDDTVDLKLQNSKDKRRLIDLRLELRGKEEFIKKLIYKRRIDADEFKKDLTACNSGMNKLQEQADNFVDIDFERNKQLLSHKGNHIQYILNEMILAREEKDDAKKVLYFNALKMELGL